jgi:hypothetical protein
VLGDSVTNIQDLLVSVFLLLDLLSGSLSLLAKTVSSNFMPQLILLGGLKRIVDRGEARGASSTIDLQSCDKSKISLIQICKSAQAEREEIWVNLSIINLLS